MDPVTQQKDHRALCRVSIVDVEKNEVLLDTLVKPTWPGTNYRTWVNGITAEHLDHVQFTLRHAQAYLMALCSNETVIIGHAVHNDLAALRIDHTVVVDSACLYSAADSETAMVSLRDIVAHVLDVDMPEKHDSVNDARMAYQVVEHFRTKKGKVQGVPRSTMANAKSSSSSHGLRASDYESQLFVHRIPKNACDEAQLLQMFLSYTHVQPIRVDEIEYGNNNSTTPDHANTSGKTHVHFSSARHGNLAFDSLDGKAVADASGRLQKKVFLKNGNYLRIRKMAYETNTNSTTATSGSAAASTTK
jgi:RNA exonuclease 1